MFAVSATLPVTHGKRVAGNAQVAVNGVRMVPATARRMAAELLAAAALAEAVNGDA